MKDMEEQIMQRIPKIRTIVLPALMLSSYLGAMVNNPAGSETAASL
jgi:hypothetical protein